MDLRFSIAETREFLNRAMALNLSETSIFALERKTEGWIAGLQLAALAPKRNGSSRGEEDARTLVESFSGRHRLVLDYLMAEVLDQQMWYGCTDGLANGTS